MALDTVNPLLKKVEVVLYATKGILSVKWVDSKSRKKISDFEEEIVKKGLSSGVGAYFNQGVVEVLSRDHVCVVLNNNEFRHASDPSLFWMVEDTVIGEEVTDPELFKMLKQKDTTSALRENFILHLDRMKETKGKQPTFVVRGLPFDELTAIPQVFDIVSASPVGSSDVSFKEYFEWDTNNSELGTIIIGFNLNEE